VTGKFTTLVADSQGVAAATTKMKTAVVDCKVEVAAAGRNTLWYQ
jgi:hypothetical protein